MTINNKRVEKYAAYIVLGLVLLISAVVRFKYMFTERLWPDEALYAWNASRIFANPFMIFSSEVNEYHPPLFALLLSVGNLLKPGLAGYQMISLLVGLLAIYVIYYVGEKVHSSFVGTLAAFALAFNFLYIKFSAKVLMDSIFMAVFLLFLYTLGKIDKGSGDKNDRWVGIWAVVFIGLKWTGLLCIPVMLIYYLIVAKGKMFPRIITPAAIILGWVSALFLNNYLQIGSVIPDLTTIMKKIQETSVWFYLLNLGGTLDYWYLIPFMFIGIGGLFKDKKNLCISFLVGWVVFLVGLSCAPERILRYSLVYLPIMIIFTMIGIDVIIRKYVRGRDEQSLGRLIVILLLGFIVFVRYSDLEFMLNEENKFSNKFSEAGAWIKDHAENDALIVATSHRQIRYFSGINFQQFGGRIIEFPSSKEELMEIVNAVRGSIILEVDNWGRQGRLMIDPITKTGITQLENMGFSVKSTAGKMRYQSEDGEELIAPALWIFEKKQPRRDVGMR